MRAIGHRFSDDTLQVNRLVEVDYSSNGALGDQWYHEGCFDLGDDEVLVVEARIPPTAEPSPFRSPTRSFRRSTGPTPKAA